MQVVVKVNNLKKYYKDVKAVDDISFEIYENECFGMVGPNGTGKTTTVECIEGLRKPDNESIEALGLDLFGDRYTLRKEIDIQLQESSLYPRIKVKEAMRLFSSFYSQPLCWKDLLERFGLEEKQNVYYDKISGGEKKRLHIALALIGDPKLVFFDELTTGLDPQACRNTWDLIKEIRNEGKIVFLTTHYMEEAEELCDRVCVIDNGKIVALDKPDTLVQNLGAESKVTFEVDGSFQVKLLEELTCVSRVEEVHKQFIVYGKGKKFLITVTQAMQSQGANLRNLQVKQPTLEDVFLTFTGREYEDETVS